jgi:predicted DNA-binding protein
MARISTTVPTTVYDALGRLAALQGRSMSNLVAYVMERYIEEMRASSASAVPDDEAA